MLLRKLLRASVRIFDTVSVTRSARRFGAESERDTSADVVDHLLRHHPGIHGAPVPLMLVGRTEPSDTVEDDGLDLDASGAILVPYALHPEVDVVLHSVVVDEFFLVEGGGVVEVSGGSGFPI